MLPAERTSAGCNGITSLERRLALVSRIYWRSSGSDTSQKNQSQGTCHPRPRKVPGPALERLLYFHSARADRLLYDTVTQILLPLRERGLVDINVQDFQRPLAKWVDEGKTTGHWSEPRSPVLPKDCSRLSGTSVSFKGPSTRRSLPPTFPSSRLHMSCSI